MAHLCSLQFSAAGALALLAMIPLETRGEDTKPERDRFELFMRGSRMSDEQAVELVEKAAADQADADSRLMLLGRCFSSRAHTPESKLAQQELIEWFVTHHPDWPECGTPYMQLHAAINPAGYSKVKKLWLAATKRHSANAQVFGNAANFLQFSEPEEAGVLLEKAELLDPQSPTWSRELGQHYLRLSRGRSQKESRRLATQSLAKLERATELDDGVNARFYALGDLAKTAFLAGKLETATAYAEELLELADKTPRDWNTGNAVHHGNLVLGRIALANGDVEEAKTCLLKTGKTSGSPQLNSFGPNMAMAKELLERGERDVVLEYFELCRKYWPRKELDRWNAAVQAGEVPNFGGNLFY